MAKTKKSGSDVMVDINSGDQVKNAYGNKKLGFILSVCGSGLAMLLGLVMIFCAVAPEVLSG